jgi:FMN phosphatase YigB (HAD superfamily)
MQHKYILFDVAGTLLHKPAVFTSIQNVLQQNGFDFEEKKIKTHHKLLSESFVFPDQTDALFYKKFNSELLFSLGVIPNEDILNQIFSTCTYLPWEKFSDTHYLNEIKIPIGIISNFNSTLKEKLKTFFDVDFKDVFVSEELGIAKPDKLFYQKAIAKTGINLADIIYVGDSLKLDIQPAQELGLNAVLIDREEYYPAFQNRIKSLNELNNFLC